MDDLRKTWGGLKHDLMASITALKKVKSNYDSTAVGSVPSAYTRVLPLTIVSSFTPYVASFFYSFSATLFEQILVYTTVCSVVVRDGVWVSNKEASPKRCISAFFIDLVFAFAFAHSCSVCYPPPLSLETSLTTGKGGAC